MTKNTIATRRVSRRGVAVASVAAMALVLAGCAGSSDAPDGKITLTVQQFSDWEPTTKVLVEAFEKEHPNIKVEMQVVPTGAEAFTNAQRISGSDAPDVAVVQANSPVFEATSTQGALLDLSDIWKSSDLENRVGSTTAAALKSDGSSYFVPIDSVYYDIVYYNADIFKKAGITPPKNHRVDDSASLIEIADKVRGAGYQPLATAGIDAAYYGWMLDGLLQGNSTDAELENFNTSYNPKADVTAKYTDKAFVDSVGTIKKWADANVFQDGFLGQDPSIAQGLFLQGQAAMMIGGSFSVSSINDSGFDYDWFLLPPVDGGKSSQIMAYYGNTVTVPTKAKHPDEAKMFIEFWLSDAMQSQATTKTSLPAVNTVPVDSLTDVLDPKVAAMVADVNKNGAPVGWTSAVPVAFGQQFAGTNIAAMLSGSQSADQVGEKQQAELEKVRSKK